MRQEVDLEAKPGRLKVDGFFVLGQQVQEKGGEAALLQVLGHGPVAGAPPAAPVPWAKTTTAVAWSGTVRSPCRVTSPCGNLDRLGHMVA